MAKKGSNSSSAAGSNAALEKARSARGAKGKRALDKDRFVLQVRIEIPVDGEIQSAAIKKFVEDGGGTFTVRTRVYKRAYEPSEENGSDAGETDTEPGAVEPSETAPA